MSDYHSQLSTRRSHNLHNDAILNFDARRSLRHGSSIHRQLKSSDHSSRPGHSAYQISPHRRLRSYSVNAATRRAMTIHLAQQRCHQNSLKSQPSINSTDDVDHGSSTSKVTFDLSPEYKSSSKMAASFGKLSIGSFVKNTFKMIANSSPSLSRRNSISGSSDVQNLIKQKKQHPTTTSKFKPIIQNKNIQIKKTTFVPGVAGIANHGNSCFVNAVVQCLSNVPPFLEYLLENCKQFEQPLTKSFVNLIQSLWLGGYNAKLSQKFRNNIAAVFNEFVNNSQNDSQEFLLLLLDKIQQELLSDKNIKNNHFQNHELMNFIRSLFEARLMSCLTCNKCHQNSFTADTQLTICLPIQEPVVIRIIRVPTTDQEKQCLHTFLFNSGQTLRQLLEIASRRFNMHPRDITLVHIDERGKYKEQKSLDSLISSIMPFHYLFFVQLVNRKIVYSSPSHSSNNNNVPNGIVQDCDDSQHSGEFVNVVILPVLEQDGKFQRFGSLISLDISRTSSHYELQMLILSRMKQYLASPFFTMKGIRSSFRMRVYVPKHSASASNGDDYDDDDADTDDDDDHEQFYLHSRDEMPLFSLIVERALSSFERGQYGTPHIRLIAEFQEGIGKYLIQLKQDKFFSKDKSCNEMDNMYNNNNIKCDLMSCLEAFTQQEQLDADDLWVCNRCRSRRLGALKTLSFTGLPEVLVIHLKRFRQDGDARTKIETHVDFPISGLDLSRLLAPDSNSSCSLASNYGSSINSSMKLNRTWDNPLSDHVTNGSNHNQTNDDFVYDLIAVCNHHGDLSNGHYTAFCKNPLNKIWYCFNDSQVKELPMSRIVSSSAYLLFYWRRGHRTSRRITLSDWLNQGASSVNGLSSTDSSQSLSSLGGIVGQGPSSLSLDNLTTNQISPSTIPGNKTNNMPLRSILKPSQSMSLSPLRHKSSHVRICEENVVDTGTHKAQESSPIGVPNGLCSKPPLAHTLTSKPDSKTNKSSPTTNVQPVISLQLSSSKRKMDEVIKKMREEAFHASSLYPPRKCASLIFKKVHSDKKIGSRTAFGDESRQRSRSQVVSKLESTV